MASEVKKPLEMNKPMFQITICENYNENSSAFLFRAHHTMMDGLTGVYLSWSLIDNPKVD